jgi:hypothetical protein
MGKHEGDRSTGSILGHYAWTTSVVLVLGAGMVGTSWVAIRRQAQNRARNWRPSDNWPLAWPTR